MNSDLLCMQLALDEAQKARIKAPPNPWVGCVLIKEGTLIGRGHTSVAGGPHAEVNALQGVNASGATAYVTLEPCCFHGKTPPCVDALIRSGVSKVVIGIEDPDPRVAGKGIARLKEAGIPVLCGVLEEKVRLQLSPYIKQRQTGRPYVVLKSAASVDGRTAAADGTSQWISSEKARFHAHRMRAESGAILVGSGTYLADKPQLTVRHGELPPKQPLRIVLDRSGKIPPAENFIITNMGLSDLLEDLGRQGILQVLVEGGPAILGAFLKEQLADRLLIYLGNKLLGENGFPLASGLPIGTLSEAPTLQLSDFFSLDETLVLDYLVKQTSVST